MSSMKSHNKIEKKKELAFKTMFSMLNKINLSNLNKLKDPVARNRRYIFLFNPWTLKTLKNRDVCVG